MKYLTRVVTFMAYPQITGNNPQAILEQGSRVLTLGDRQRVFTVRKVAYDDSMTPLYAVSIYSHEVNHKSYMDLLQSHPGLADKPILDLDNYLMIYDHE